MGSARRGSNPLTVAAHRTGAGQRLLRGNECSRGPAHGCDIALAPAIVVSASCAWPCLVPACGAAVLGVRFGGQLAAALPRCGLFASGLRPLASRSHTRRRRRGGGQCCATRRSAAKVSGTPLAGNKVASWRCTARTAASSTLTREATAWTRLRTAAHPAATCGNVQAGEPSGACGRKPSGCAGRRVRQMHGRRLPDHCGRCGRPESRARVRRFASSCTSCVGGSR